MRLRAFNLIPGLVLDTDDSDFVVVGVERDIETEKVNVLLRDERDSQPLLLEFDYCDEVSIIGVSVNPEDPDDDDFGTDTVKKRNWATTFTQNARKRKFQHN